METQSLIKIKYEIISKFYILNKYQNKNKKRKEQEDNILQIKKQHIIKEQENNIKIDKWFYNNVPLIQYQQVIGQSNISSNSLEKIIIGIQNKNFRIDEVINLRNFYEDQRMGEVVMLFSNPDFLNKFNNLKYKKNNFQQKLLTLQDALNIFDKQILVQSVNGFSSFEIQKLRKAFINSFYQLQPINQNKKIEKNGGQFYFNQKQNVWKIKNEQPQDFISLIRNIILTILTYDGMIKCQLHFSQNGKFIIAILKMTEEGMIIQAQKLKLNKQLELGAIDLLSFEPVDRKYRPFRLKNQIQNSNLLFADSNLSKKIYNIFENEFNRLNSPIFIMEIEIEIVKGLIYLLIDKQLNKILHQIQKETGMQILFQQDPQFGIKDDIEISSTELRQYLFYLIVLIKNLQFVKIAGLNQKYVEMNELQNKNHNFYLNRDIKISDSYYKQYCNFDSKKKKKFWTIFNKQKFFLYKLIFRKAIDIANKQFFPSKLKNIYNRLQEVPQGGYCAFRCKNQKEKQFWRTFETNENGKRNLFLHMECIKMIYQITKLRINLFKLLSDQIFLIDFFPLHNYFQLFGKLQSLIIKPLTQQGILEGENYDFQSQYQMINYFIQKFESYGESTDFESDSYTTKELKFNKKKPWYIDINCIRNYFGEKLALYFQFLSFYTVSLIPISIIGLIIQICDWSKIQFKLTRELMSIINILWSVLFFYSWKYQQQKFSQQFGQEQVVDSKRQEFYGIHKREISNDNLNEKQYPHWKKQIKLCISWLVSLSIITISVAFSLFILYLQYKFKDKGNITLINIIGSICNSIQIMIFNLFYSNIAQKLNKFENHSSPNSLEHSLLCKIFAFEFMNTFNSFFIIAFLSNSFPFISNICEQKDCFQTLSIRVVTIFIVMFIKNIPELLQPLMANYIKKKQFQQQNFSQINPFYKIINEVEEQMALQSYQQNFEIDGTFSDYLELIFQFGFLILFSTSFPLSYLMALISNIVEIQIDKYKLLKCTRMPFPQSAKTIGVWEDVLKLLIFFSILCNAGILAFTIQKRNLALFIIFTILSLCFTQVIKNCFPQPNQVLILRQQQLFERIFSQDVQNQKINKVKLINPFIYDINKIYNALKIQNKS